MCIYKKLPNEIITDKISKVYNSQHVSLLLFGFVHSHRFRARSRDSIEDEPWHVQLQIPRPNRRDHTSQHAFRLWVQGKGCNMQSRGVNSPGWTSFDYAGVGAGGEGTAVKTDASAVMASWLSSGTKRQQSTEMQLHRGRAGASLQKDTGSGAKVLENGVDVTNVQARAKQVTPSTYREEARRHRPSRHPILWRHLSQRTRSRTCVLKQEPIYPSILAYYMP